MKKYLLSLSILHFFVTSVPAFAVTVEDLRTVLNDPTIRAYLEKNDLVQIKSLGQESVTKCGPNPPVYEKITFLKRGVWTTQELEFKIAAGDGNCNGKAPRTATLVNPTAGQ